METPVVIAGFGGQGVLFARQLLAYTGMDSGYQVTWILDTFLWARDAWRHGALYSHY
jgi:Pyruvate/2-oxoacid:ferredoxin oxidoreductase gamma subunit